MMMNDDEVGYYYGQEEVVASSTNEMTTSSQSMDDVSGSLPINEPAIRMWELNESSTHYDRMVAAPSDDDLIKFWKGWASIMIITGVVTTVILIPLLSCSLRGTKVRRNPFNVYLIFLMAPDMLVAWTCGFTCLSNALVGHFTSEFMCRFQSFYMIASIGANSWLNLLITRQLYHMLNAARQFQRYPMPTNRQVIKEALCVYAYSLFLATLGILPFNANWWPHQTRLTIGAACIPMDYSYASTAFFYAVFFPLLFGIPLAYVCWAAYQIYKHNMLPPSGRRRILAVYFFRLAAVFVLMWLPGLLLLFVVSAWINPWVQWAGGAWSHLQGLVSALLSLLKPDIWKAVKDFWFCAAPNNNVVTTSSFDDNQRTKTNTSIITKKPWANSSVYWSSQIGLGGSAHSSKSGNKNNNNNNKQSIQSRVSSYREADDDLEAVGQLNHNCTTLETRHSNVLASDDSISLELDAMEMDEEEAGEEEEEPDLEGGDRATALPGVAVHHHYNNSSNNNNNNKNLATVEEESRGMSGSSSRRSHHGGGCGTTMSASISSSRRKREDATDAPVGTIYIVPKA